MKNFLIGAFAGYFIGGFGCSYLIFNLFKKGVIKNV